MILEDRTTPDLFHDASGTVEKVNLDKFAALCAKSDFVERLAINDLQMGKGQMTHEKDLKFIKRTFSTGSLVIYNFWDFALSSWRAVMWNFWWPNKGTRYYDQ